MTIEEAKRIIYCMLDKPTKDDLFGYNGLDGDSEEEDILECLNPNFIYDTNDGVFRIKEISREHDRDDSCEVVYELEHIESGEILLICWSGWDASYGESEYDEPYFVKAKEKTITVYERI